jgi:glycerophosphoryl diester phosphodiesterase
MVTKAETAALRKRGIGVNTWSVNEPADIIRVTEAGVNAIMGDSPATIRTTLGI